MRAPVGSVGVGFGIEGAADCADAAASANLAPHWAQKREPGALRWPQALQFAACGAPHCGQKRLPSGISAPQLEQALVCTIATG